MNIYDQHKELVSALSKPGDEIKSQLTPFQANLLHMAVGVAGEAGELLDAIKKHCIYQKPLDVENTLEELGDLRFYMQGIMSALELTEEDVLRHNIEKLSKRYSSGKYSNAQAIERADK